MSHTIIYLRSDGISTISLNRPEKLNSLSAEMVEELRSQLTTLETEPALRAVILTGEGERVLRGHRCRGTADKSEAEAIEISPGAKTL
jgi:2-(1,2-epoxy-1,2-dihydrophenyl)acetyl-CoA isomerase